jgi:hypothetical protein
MKTLGRYIGRKEATDKLGYHEGIKFLALQAHLNNTPRVEDSKAYQETRKRYEDTLKNFDI